MACRRYGRAVEPGRLQRTFRLRHRTRTVRAYGHIRLQNFGMFVDQSLWGQPVDVLIYDDAVRVEQAEHLLVSYPCVYDTVRRRITSIDARGRQQYHQFQGLQLALWAVDLIRSVWRMISLFEPFAH